jgi:hypothetical protein
VPDVVLPSTGDDNLFEVHPDLSDQVIFLVLVEDGAFKLVVVGRLVYGKAEFLIPWKAGQYGG